MASSNPSSSRPAQPHDHPVALVTGCRSGFGLAIAVALARAGYKVYAGLRDPTTGAGLARAAEGLAVVPVALDVTDAAARERAVADILAVDGRLDVLVNNAGVSTSGPLEETSEAELRRVLDVNLVAAWGMTTAVLPAMRAAGRGHVIMISSMSGRMAMPLLGAYAASKFGLEALAEAWRHELAPFGIQVVLVEPGPYKTDLFRLTDPTADAPTGPYAALRARFRELEGKVFERAGDPAEIGALVVKLAGQAHPALRHPIGPTAKLRTTLKSVLPAGAFEALIRRVVGPALKPAGRPVKRT